MKEILKELPISHNYKNSFEYNGDTYHYKNAPLLECQVTHLLSLFINEVGVDSVIYDYDEETGISYCKSMINENERINEIPIIDKDNQYDLYHMYFNLKEDINRFPNSNELLIELRKGYLIASLFNDIDKNIGYIKDSNNNIRLAPYFDLGSFFSNLHEYHYSNYLDHDIDISEGNIKVLKDCLQGVPEEIVNNIINFDINSLIERDNHEYSDESKVVINQLFNKSIRIAKELITSVNKKTREI